MADEIELQGTEYRGEGMLLYFEHMRRRPLLWYIPARCSPLANVTEWSCDFGD